MHHNIKQMNENVGKNASDESNVFLLMGLYMCRKERRILKNARVDYNYSRIAKAENAGTLTFLNLIFFFSQVLACRLANLNLKLKRIAWDIVNVIIYPNFIVPSATAVV